MEDASKPNKTLLKKQAVIESLLQFSNISKACAAADISRWSYYEWLKKDKEFLQQVEAIEEALIDRVEGALYKRAFGYSYVETTKEIKSKSNPVLVITKEVTKKVAPDTTALIYVTANRRGRRWKARQAPGSATGEIKNINISVRVSGNGQGGNGGNPQKDGKSIERILNGL